MSVHANEQQFRVLRESDLGIRTVLFKGNKKDAYNFARSLLSKTELNFLLIEARVDYLENTKVARWVLLERFSNG